MGYIGGTPRYPRIAYSIRLLRWYHAHWKHGGVALQPFSTALDEFLDEASPILLVKGSDEVGTSSSLYKQ